jgi:Mycothiol maleylpyruvate isomerase N-terminal domain
MELRDDYAAKEETAWQAFLTVVASVPPDRREDPTVVPGWSVKDLIWHNAAWTLFAATELEKLTGRPFQNPFDTNDDAHWDRLSETMIEEGRTKTFDEVLTDSEHARERARAIWNSLPTVEEQAAQWFAEESFIHYEEHMKEIQQYLNRA